MFSGVTVECFDDPGFKEDSVRELIIAPILSRLGYFPTGTTRVIRSKSLVHPFIQVGTRKHPVVVVPDYTIVHNEKPVFVLDAKRPSEGVLDQEHVQQAYSYAMHPEVNCREFGICNGKELAIFDVFHREPQTVLRFDEFEVRWADVERFLSIECLLEPQRRRFAPDFGLALLQSGGGRGEHIFLGIRPDFFARVNDSLYTASGNVAFGSTKHCVSFDFASSMLPQVVEGLPKRLGELFTEALSRAPFHAIAGMAIELDVSTRLGSLTKGEHGEFIPLIIEQIIQSRFNPEPVEPAVEAEQYPSRVFQLREAFTIIGDGR